MDCQQISASRTKFLFSTLALFACDFRCLQKAICLKFSQASFRRFFLLRDSGSSCEHWRAWFTIGYIASISLLCRNLLFAVAMNLPELHEERSVFGLAVVRSRLCLQSEACLNGGWMKHNLLLPKRWPIVTCIHYLCGLSTKIIWVRLVEGEASFGWENTTRLQFVHFYFNICLISSTFQPPKVK